MFALLAVRHDRTILVGVYSRQALAQRAALEHREESEEYGEHYSYFYCHAYVDQRQSTDCIPIRLPAWKPKLRAV